MVWKKCKLHLKTLEAEAGKPFDYLKWSETAIHEGTRCYGLLPAQFQVKEKHQEVD